MSGYDSISDWAFENFDIDDYDFYEEFLDDIEKEFDTNGRGIPLDDIFDSSDFDRLEKEFNKRKGIVDDEEEAIEFEKIEKQKDVLIDLEKEALEKFTLINERWQKEVEEIVEDLPPKTKIKLLRKFKNKVTKFFKGLFGQ